MVQPALKQDGIPDEIWQLAEQLNAGSPLGERLQAANTDHSASALARRFAPDRARQRAAAADPTVLPRIEPASNQPAEAPRRFALAVMVGLASAAALVGGMMWLGGIEDLNLDRVFEDAGLVSNPGASPHTSAALSISISPPRSSALSIGAGGDGEVRTAARPEVAPPLSPGFAVRSGETDRIEGLMAHGRKMIDVGYFAGARAYYRRAAEAGSGEAALAVGATYDPDIIARMGVQGIKPDRAQAAKWYARAAGLGIADRDATLSRLTQGWGTEPALPEPAGIMASASPAQGISAPLGNPHATQARVRIAQKLATAQDVPTAQNEAIAQEAPVSKDARQRVASNRTSATSSVRPQLLASDEEPKPGPLSMFMRAATSLSAQEEWMEVRTPVNIRKAPSSTAGSDKVALTGTKLRVVGREGNWVRIADPKTAREGYIHNRFLKESSAP